MLSLLSLLLVFASLNNAQKTCTDFQVRDEGEACATNGSAICAPRLDGWTRNVSAPFTGVVGAITGRSPDAIGLGCRKGVCRRLFTVLPTDCKAECEKLIESTQAVTGDTTTDLPIVGGVPICLGQLCLPTDSPDGSPCKFGRICAGEDMVCFKGRCHKVQILHVGDEGCADPLKKCVAHSYCAVPIPTTGICKWTVKEHGSCIRYGSGGIKSPQCGTGLCNKAGKCVVGLSEGHVCDGNITTSEENFCEPHLTCDADTKTCVAPWRSKPTLEAAEQICKTWEEGQPWPCVGENIMVCTGGRPIQGWSLEAEQTTDAAAACRAELWYAKKSKKCVSKLQCSENSDCHDASPYAPNHLVFCNCDTCDTVPTLSQCFHVTLHRPQSKWCSAKAAAEGWWPAGYYAFQFYWKEIFVALVQYEQKHGVGGTTCPPSTSGSCRTGMPHLCTYSLVSLSAACMVCKALCGMLTTSRAESQE
eukprot:TRINITY_DN113078_c0_g1_i1.p1 TRINITY_DN113078_c0_g1~~TRINITY_DN113078_c0_g1_i1.p1  ORF type:complete len:475 (+),score=20.19 TRINITY_DN113078_c0_g1_i1:11-1435(+)